MYASRSKGESGVHNIHYNKDYNKATFLLSHLPVYTLSIITRITTA